MKMRFPLYAKILGWFFLNLLALAVVLAVVFRSELGGESDWLLTRTAQNRIQRLGNDILYELQSKSEKDWDDVLNRFSTNYQIKFSLFAIDGRQLAGEKISLPRQVQDEARKRPREDATRPGPPNDVRGDARILDEESSLPDAGPPPFRDRRDGRPGPGSGRNPIPQLIHTSHPTDYWLLLRMPLRIAGMPRGPAVLILHSPSMNFNGLVFDPRPWLIGGAGALAFTALLWFPFVRGLTRSLARMSRATEQVAQGQFDIRLSAKRNDELGALAEAVNHMAARLGGYVTGQKRFLGDIAHELCAPIARIQMALGILEQRADEKQRPYVNDLLEEMQHMSNLVNELLSFSRASLRQKDLPLEAVNLAETIQRVVAREAPAPDAVEILVADNLWVLAERELLGRAIANLVRNAIRYAGSAGPVSLTAQPSGSEVVILITDRGPGIPAEQMEHLFEPFFRSDAARTRETGGTGLGLAIVKSCLDACRARITCRNLQPHGFQAEIVLPAVPPGNSAARAGA